MYSRDLLLTKMNRDKFLDDYLT